MRSLITAAICLAIMQLPDSLVAAGSNKMSPKTVQAFISFRVGVPLWENPVRFKELLELFDRYQGVTDEISFFYSADENRPAYGPPGGKTVCRVWTSAVRNGMRFIWMLSSQGSSRDQVSLAAVSTTL